jgi:nuclear control of ATPase protein 2
MSISHITSRLIQSSTPSHWCQTSSEPSINLTVLPSNDALRSLFLSLSPPLSPSSAIEGIKYLRELENENSTVSSAGYASRGIDGEEGLKVAILGRLVAGIYAQTLDTLLAEAITAEIEAEWWADLERSRLRVAYYFIQSTPSPTSFHLFVSRPNPAFSLTSSHLQSLRRRNARTTFK